MDVAGGEWETLFLTAPSLSIRGGTDEIQRNIMGERVLGLPPTCRVDKDRPFGETLAPNRCGTSADEAGVGPVGELARAGTDVPDRQPQCVLAARGHVDDLRGGGAGHRATRVDGGGGTVEEDLEAHRARVAAGAVVDADVRTEARWTRPRL